jgi:hypothetical protein
MSKKSPQEIHSSAVETVQKRRLEAVLTALAVKKMLDPQDRDWSERRRKLLREQTLLLRQRGPTCQTVPPRELGKTEL